MKKLLILLGVANISLIACNHENKSADSQSTHTDTSATATTATTTEADYEVEYQERAQRLSQQMATDLKFDTATTAKVQQVYQNREHRLAEVRNKYNYSHNATVRSGGNAQTANENTTNNAAMRNEMQIIDGEVNGELRNILNPEQYKTYESKKADYVATAPSQDKVKREIKRDGDEITVKTGDIKVKAEPGKSKVETSTYESKIKGDERKFKSKISDTKIKSEPGKAKYESGNTKIKVEEE